MNGYLIPANAKKGTLIFNVFRPFDLYLFGGGIALSFFLLVILENSSVLLTTLALLPVAITGLLVFPFPNYHNVLCVIISIYKYYTGRRKYVWKGWCYNERFEDKKSNK